MESTLAMFNKNTYVISDLHLYHRGSLPYRGFNSLEDMHQAIRDGWCHVVNNGDLVFILGDLYLGKSSLECYQAAEFIDSLPGCKYWVMGNHDNSRADQRVFRDCFIGIGGAVRFGNSKRHILTHFPIHPTEAPLGKVVNYHGHTHLGTIYGDSYVNCCVEYVEYKPVKINFDPDSILGDFK